MHILITNDDGVQAPGILALAQALREIAQVTVFAPNRSWSTAGHSKTLHRPLRAHEYPGRRRHGIHHRRISF
jgi:5'-nucleotidase